MSKTPAESTRGNLFHAFPDAFTIVREKTHPLYDERVNLPLDEGLVASIMHVGVLEPITVRKDGDVLQVVFGRQRVLNTEEANKRLEKAGKPPVRVPYIITRGDDAGSFGKSVHENEHRRNDSLIVKARKAQRMFEMGAGDDEVEVAFGVGVNTIKYSWLPLLDCSREVQSAVDAGRVSANDAAKKLAKLPRDKQNEALAEIASAPAASVEDVTERHGKRRAKKQEGVSRTRLRRLLLLIENDKRKPLDPKQFALLGWVNGGVSDEELCKELPMLTGILEFLDRPKQKRGKREPKSSVIVVETPRVVSGSRVQQGPVKRGRKKAA